MVKKCCQVIPSEASSITSTLNKIRLTTGTTVLFKSMSIPGLYEAQHVNQSVDLSIYLYNI